MVKYKTIFEHIIFIITAVCILFVVFIVFTLLKTFGDGIYDDDVNNYINAKYMQYPGSEAVAGFFPEYNMLSNYSILDFHYFDGRSKTTFFHQFFISYSLDVKYDDQNVYKHEKQNLFSIAGGVEESLYGSFTGCEIITKQDDIFRYICFDDKKYIIRYLAFYGDKAKYTSLVGLIKWNTALNW